MNYTKNDYGELVAAIGAPNSTKRFECEHPSLIKEIEKYWDFDGVDKEAFPNFSNWFYFCCNLYKLDSWTLKIAEEYFL